MWAREEEGKGGGKGGERMNWAVVRRLIWKKECFPAPVNDLPNIGEGGGEVKG